MKPEPRNIFYFLLLVASLLFVLTALAYALVPFLEEKAIQAGNPPPKSALRDNLRENGWRWLLYEVGAMIVFAFLSMGLDRFRRLQKDREAARISPNIPGEEANKE